MRAHVAIIGAGPAGLACAEILSKLNCYDISIYEQKPSAARKFLMAGKTGLNISHNEPLADFIARYDHAENLAPMIHQFHAEDIQIWMEGFGIESYVGSSGRIFPNEMKAAPLLRAWLKSLQTQGVKFFYKHQCLGIAQHQIQIKNLVQEDIFEQDVNAVVLACGAISWPQLGSDGQWLSWLDPDLVLPFTPSNVGVKVTWSNFMTDYFGQPLKRIKAYSDALSSAQFGEMVISHYGLEGGLVYRCNRGLRADLLKSGAAILYLDLLPDLSQAELEQKLSKSQKLSLNTLWQRVGLDKTKIALIRDVISKTHWNDAIYMAKAIKTVEINVTGFQSIEQAISCAGGIKLESMTDDLQFKHLPHLFACGEMLDWDAPTGGYLLTACLATGRQAALGVHRFLQAI